MDPAANGGRRAEIRSVESQRELISLGADRGKCTQSERFRSEQFGQALRRFERPQVDVRDEETQVQFMLWSIDLGELFSYDVRLALDGRAQISRISVAGHLGEHEDGD